MKKNKESKIVLPNADIISAMESLKIYGGKGKSMEGKVIHRTLKTPMSAVQIKTAAARIPILFSILLPPATCIAIVVKLRLCSLSEFHTVTRENLMSQHNMEYSI